MEVLGFRTFSMACEALTGRGPDFAWNLESIEEWYRERLRGTVHRGPWEIDWDQRV